VCFVQRFLSKEECDDPSFSNLAPTGFYLFPLLEPAFKRRRFLKPTDIIKNAGEELKGFLTKLLQEMFPGT
jgi:hypothetical protein